MLATVLAGASGPFIAGFGVALAASVFLVWSKRWHGGYSTDNTAGVQKFHRGDVPRIGGLAVCAGLCAAAAASEPPVARLLAAIVIGSGIAFAVGLAEDVTGRVSPLIRLLATLFSGLAFCFLTGIRITHIGFSDIDRLLAISAVGIAFTTLTIAGIAHAINIVDGFNGLVGGTAVILLVALAALSYTAGDREMAAASFATAGVSLGFLLVNFPSGRLFLGDGGAYFLGIVLAAFAIIIPARNPSISPWTGVVVLAYPILEMLVSIIRKISRTRAPYKPDRLHLHMLVYRRFGKRIANASGNRERANSFTGMLMWSGPLASLGLILAVPPTRDWSLFSCALLFAFYILSYAIAIGRWRRYAGRPSVGRGRKGRHSSKDG